MLIMGRPPTNKQLTVHVIEKSKEALRVLKKVGAVVVQV